MLSSSLHKHLDGMDALEDEMQLDIDFIMSAIDKKALVNDPTGVMEEVAMEIKKLLEDKYIPMAAKLGLSLNDTINSLDEKGEKIIIDASKDGKENEALV